MNYAGMHFPNGAEDWGRIVALPSPLLLMLATEARYHYDAARQAGKTVIWRGLPRVGKRPAELGWSNLAKNAAEALNLWDEQPHSGTEWFVPYNELDLNYERGDSQDDFSGIAERYHLLTSFLSGLRPELRRQLPDGTKLLFPPFTPDHGDIEQSAVWIPTARAYDGLVVHAYEDPAAARKRLDWYLTTFPDHPIFLGEWNAPDPHAFLDMLRDVEATYPNFGGATYFCWHWYGAPGYWPDSYNVDRNDDLYRLFLTAPALNPPINPPINPPVNPPVEAAMTLQEKIDLIVKLATEAGEVPYELLGGAFAESGENLDQWERYGVWPDVSFGMFQQTVKYAAEGDHSESAENIALIKSLYADPEHATRVAMAQYAYWRHDPDVDPTQAWCGYNGGSGGYHNWKTSQNLANYQHGLALAQTTLGAAMPTINQTTYGPEIPNSVILQQNDWSCAVRSTYAAFWVLAQEGLIDPVSYGDNGPRDVYNWMVPKYDDSSVGLHFADGSGLVALCAEHGLVAHAQTGVTLADVGARAGVSPVLIGGHAWNHWVYVRGVEADGTLVLANPSPGYDGVANELRDSFGRLGPFTLVWIEIPKPAQPPAPAPSYEFLFGFKAKADELGASVVGEPIEAEHALSDRFNMQTTTTGLMLYSKATNEVTFVGG